MLKGNTAEPPGATLNAVGACGVRSTLYCSWGPTSATITTAKRAVLGTVVPITFTVHTPISGVSTSTCSTVFTASYDGGLGVLHPFVYRSPRYSVPPGAITWSSRFRWSELPEGSSQTSVILRGTSLPTTFVFSAPV